MSEVGLGRSLDAGARAAGVTPRTLRRWCSRAWSARPEDAPYVELEQAISRTRLAALAAAAELGPPGAEPALSLDELFSGLPSLEELLSGFGGDDWAPAGFDLDDGD